MRSSEPENTRANNRDKNSSGASAVSKEPDDNRELAIEDLQSYVEICIETLQKKLKYLQSLSS